MQIRNIKVNHVANPVGFDLSGGISIGYTVEEADGKRQKSLQIIVYQNEELVFDSGLILERAPVYPVALALAPRTRYRVFLQVVSDAGETAAAHTWFETGKCSEAWRAQWISPAAESTAGVPRLSKSFLADGPIRQARAYVGCAGLYRMCANGSRVGAELLTPYCNDYQSWLQAITHDLTEYLHPGENTIDFTLADGWYKGAFTYERTANIYGDTLGLICEIHIQYEDGRKQVISSDDSFRCGASEFVEADLYDGNVVDYRQSSMGVLPVQRLPWATDKIRDRLSLPVCIQEELPVQRVFTTPKGEVCLDMGQNMVGWLAVDTGHFPKKDFALRYFEVLTPEGNVYTDNLRTARQAYVYRSDGTGRILEPEFTYYGFRYIQVEGLGGQDDFPTGAFVGKVVYSALRQTGFIETASPLVNRLFENALWSQKGNFVDIPTDCPQRDERMGWTGDAQVFCGTAYYNMDAAAFYAKYMADMRYEQIKLGGGMPTVVPTVATGAPETSMLHDCVAGWGDAATIIPWESYLHTGDRAMLAAYYPMMKDWVEYVRGRGAEEAMWQGDFQLGDWLALDNPNPGRRGLTPLTLMASAYYLHSATLTAKAARALGRHSDELQYMELARRIQAAIRHEYVTPSGRIASDTQTADVFALYTGFASDSRVAAASLNEKLMDTGHLNTGFYGTAYLCRVLSDFGYSDTAYRLLLSTDYPSWLYEVEKGATTIWERWNSIHPDGALGDVEMNSFNHYAYGAVVEWLYRNAAGLQPLEEFAGFQKIRYAPQPNPRLPWLIAAYDTATGRYVSEWEVKPEGLKYRLIVPFNGAAKLYLPNAPERIIINGEKNRIEEGMELDAGEYHISYQPVVG